MKNTIYIVPIEPIDQRYTAQWYTNIPLIIKNNPNNRFNVVTIDGKQLTARVTKGAFLNFAATNAYKASQVEVIAEMFNNGKVIPGDKFLITDAWNFAITAIKYMSELLDIPVEIHSIWHAGNYDPSDILGMKMSVGWASNVERSWYLASDYNYFATHFHANMFVRNLNVDASKAYRSGQPHTPLIVELSMCNSKNRKDIIMFPHRYNTDKQPNIMEDIKDNVLAETCITQKLNLTKEQYYKILGKAKVVFSCSLHENLGISMMEGVLAGAIPVVPDRCSYSEMYLDEFKYPSEWTTSFDSYVKNKDNVIKFINEKIYNYDAYFELMNKQKEILVEKYLSPTVMVNKLLD